jgi:hypothetical protein
MVANICICRFNELFGGQQAMDRVRNQRMPAVGPTLDYIGTFSKT